MKTDEFDDPGITLMGLMFEATSGAGELLEAAFSADGQLSGQLFEPLIRLARTDGARLRMSDLAGQCHYNVSTLTRVADRLVDLGFAERQACPEDRRAMYLALTDGGRTAMRSVMPDHVAVINDQIFGGLDESERRTLAELLRRVRDAVNPDATMGSNP